jgi:hypothetical protein
MVRGAGRGFGGGGGGALAKRFVMLIMQSEDGKKN